LKQENYTVYDCNKLIADFFKSLGLIEEIWLRYQKNIGRFFQRKSPRNVFENISDGFVVTVSDSEKENDTENVTEKRQKRIIEIIKSNPKITTAELSEKLAVTRITLHSDLEKIKEAGRIKRIVLDKGRYWEVLI
jgi:ATP-dependent DNA helicase RecG